MLSLTTTAPSSVGIVGGGLAGLSTAFHLLNKTNGACHITIYDPCLVGTGGASSVAGGLFHPLSPRGKIVHWGLEGFAATNLLVDHASRYQPNCVVRQDMYRIATTDQNVVDLKRTATQVPHLCEWIDAPIAGCGPDVLGGVKLQCRVLHVPTYLKGLLMACQAMGTVEWNPNTPIPNPHSHTVVVLAAGAGLWNDDVIPDYDRTYPVELVRGQAMDLIINQPSKSQQQQQQQHAILAGKYMTPLPDPTMVHIGATQEFGTSIMTPKQVQEELTRRTSFLSLWDSEPTVHRILSGVRVQTQRGHDGRLPILDKRPNQTYVFTGLSFRGLLYHGIYGDVLTDDILGRRDIFQDHLHLNWWRPK